MTQLARNIIILTLLLVVFGLVMLSSAGIVDGQKKFGSEYYYFNHQILNGILPGLLLFFIFSKVKYKFWKKISLPLLIFSLALLLAVFVPRFGFSAKGATRWLNFGLVSFQPSEILKLSLIIYFAAWFSGRSEKIQSWSYSIVPFFVILGFVGLILVLAIAFFVLVQLAPYRFDRFLTFFNPASDPQGISYHINQSLIAVGRGGLWGVGFGQSQQKLGFLPEPVGDSIFAVVAEELGLVGAASLITLFFLLSLQLVKITQNSTDRFGGLFALGVAVWVASQSLINIGAITGLLPLTGIPLPFVSYGGTSIATLLAGLGIAVNVAKTV